MKTYDPCWVQVCVAFGLGFALGIGLTALSFWLTGPVGVF